MTYKDLYTIGHFFEKSLKNKKDNGVIGNYSVDVIPDDLKVKIVLVRIAPIKNIKCSIALKSKKNTDNEK